MFQMLRRFSRRFDVSSLVEFHDTPIDTIFFAEFSRLLFRRFRHAAAARCVFRLRQAYAAPPPLIAAFDAPPLRLRH